MSNVVNVTTADFSAVVEQEHMPVLIDFWAPWCGYCTLLAPIIDELANTLEEKVKCVKVNVDENAKLAEKYGVMMLPTLLVTVNGQEVEKLVGAAHKDEILSKLSSYF